MTEDIPDFSEDIETEPLGEENKSFLAFRVKLTDEIKEKLDSIDEEFVVYDGSEAEHKIPHVTIVGPRKSFDVDDWKEKIDEKIEETPTKFAITSFNSFWSSSKLGFKGALNGKVDVETPHLVLFDCEKGDEGTKRVWSEYEPTFSDFEGVELDIESVAVIQKDRGIVYEEKVVGKGDSTEKNEKRDKFLENCLYLPVAPKDAKKRKIECENSDCGGVKQYWQKRDGTPEEPKTCPQMRFKDSQNRRDRGSQQGTEQFRQS